MSEQQQQQSPNQELGDGDNNNEATSGLETPPPEELVKEEEMKLKIKFPTAVRPGGSLFLQKKLLQRDKKYFDSGDYNVARGQAAKGPQPKLKGVRAFV